MSLEFWLTHDPQCPGCRRFHPRKRVGQSMTFVVDRTKDEHGNTMSPPCRFEKGPIPIDSPARKRA